MNELDLIASVRPEVPLPSADDLAAARRRLTTALTPAQAASAAQAASPPRTPPAAQAPGGRQSGLGRIRPSWSLAVIVTGTAAAGIAISLVVTSAVSAGRTHSPRGHASRPGLARSSPTRPGSARSIPATLTAAQFLTAAAAAVRTGHGVAPRPGQYIYTKNVNGNLSWTKEWLSADGSRPGLSIGSGQPASAAIVQPPCTVAQASSTGCFLSAGYLPGLPVKADDVLAYLAKLNLASASAPAGQDTPNWLANDTGKAVGELLSTTYLLPAQQAAVFRMLAGTPGFRLVPYAADAIGRVGVGIYWPYENAGAMIIFDPVTYRFLGFGTWPEGQGLAPSSRPARRGNPVAAPDGSALATIAIVDNEPSLPRPTKAPQGPSLPPPGPAPAS